MDGLESAVSWRGGEFEAVFAGGGEGKLAKGFALTEVFVVSEAVGLAFWSFGAVLKGYCIAAAPNFSDFDSFGQMGVVAQGLHH